jgi:branched-chain amino acid transport system substrate-binding protein
MLRKVSLMVSMLSLFVVSFLVPSSGAASASTAPSPVNVGLICSCTGAFASSLVGDEATYKAWASATNAAGGINGHKVKIFFSDDLTNPATSKNEVETMVTSDHVVAIMDDSDVDTAWEAFANQHNVPVVGGGLGGTIYNTDPDWFPEGQTLNALEASFVVAAKKAGAKSTAFFYCAESPGCAEGVPYIRTLATKFKTPLVYTTSIAYAAPNYLAQCVAAKQSGAQALIVADAALVVQSAVADCAKQGYTPIDVVDGSAVALSFTSTPGLKDNLLAIQSDIPFSVTANAGMKAMRAALRKYAPSVLTSPSFGETIVFQWVSGQLLAAAIKAAHVKSGEAVTSAEIKTGLYSFHGNTLGGMAPPLTFKKGAAHPVNCWFWMRLKGGVFTTPYGLKTSCYG